LKSKIPLCFYPTQIVFVDDNTDFLESISLIFAKHFNIKLFNESDAALKYINELERETSLVEKNIQPKPQGESDTWVKQVLTHRNLKRFDQLKIREVSVLIVDYSMPTINGIEFCEKISNPSIKKILLTGQATSRDAVRAFNSNTIHYYLKKNDEHMLEELESAIIQLQHAYFNELSSSIKAEAIDSGTPFFADPQLAQYFKVNCENLKIAEYYYLTNPSRFALQTNSDRKYLCIIYTEDDIIEHLQIMLEEGASNDLIAAIESRKLIPLFQTEDGFYEPGISDPLSNLHPAELIKGNVNYYCAIIEEPLTNSPPLATTNTSRFH
jgi:CheY-like chemotaxis protein